MSENKLTDAKVFIFNQTHLDIEDLEDDQEDHNFSPSMLAGLLQSYAKPLDEQIKDLRQYIIDTYESGVDSETLKARAEQYKKYIND